MNSTTALSRSKSAAELARLIREQGRLKGWLAEQMGISPERLTRLLRGATITLPEAAAAARALNVPLDTFIDERRDTGATRTGGTSS